MIPSIQAVNKVDESRRNQRTLPGEVLLLGSSVISLIVSCILWSSHKQAWMDENFTWKEVSDPSLPHLYHAIQHGADGGMPIFYATAWLWARCFGTGVLTLRLYSCVAMCGALIVTWRTIRRFYGVWATAFGVLTMWGTSALLLYQNAEARYYGLYILAVAIAVNIYARLVLDDGLPGNWLLISTLLCQASLVLIHVLGIIYSGLILLAIVMFDIGRHQRRMRLYVCHMAGWLALLVWIPAIRASMASAKPHGWIGMPTVTNLLAAYLFQNSFVWMWLFRIQSHKALAMAVLCGAALVIFVPLTSVVLFCLRILPASDQRDGSIPRNAILLVACLLLVAPIGLFALSHWLTPVFVPRYILPTAIGMAIVLAAFADALGSDGKQRTYRLPKQLWVAIVLFLALSPVISVLALPPISMDTYYLDVKRLDETTPANAVIVTNWVNDFTKVMRYSNNPQGRYYFLLDWSSAVEGARGQVAEYHLMQAYRDSGYYAQNIVDARDFLCSHPDFLVLGTDKQNWFDVGIRKQPEFEWRVINSFAAREVKRDLIAVHRKATPGFCSQAKSSLNAEPD
jgi:hypothetical protein